MYRGMFVLFKESKSVGSKISMRFVGFDPEEPTPVLQSIDQQVPDGANQIATFDNVDGLTDLLIAGKQLSWLSAKAGIQGRKNGIIIEDSDAYTDTTQLQIAQSNGGVIVWSLTSSSVLSCQEFTITSSYTPPGKKTKATPLLDQDGRSDRFATLPNPRLGQKTIVITRHAVMMMLEEARAFANAPAITAAREMYINHLDQMLQLHEQLDAKLALVETESKAANDKLSEVYKTLEDHLKTTDVTSTVSSATSIVGVILLFTPVAPLGVLLTAGGAIGSIGSTVAQNFFFEPEASKAFVEVINNYNSSSKGLHDLFLNIEKTKQKLIESLTSFLTLLHADPFPDPSVGARPSGTGDPNVHSPYSHQLLNGFSKIASKRFAVLAEGAKPLVDVGVKTATELAEFLGKTYWLHMLS